MYYTNPLSLTPWINLSLQTFNYRGSWILHAFLLAITTMSYLTPIWINHFTNLHVLVMLRTAYSELPPTPLPTATRRATHVFSSLPRCSILLIWLHARWTRPISIDEKNHPFFSRVILRIISLAFGAKCKTAPQNESKLIILHFSHEKNRIPESLSTFSLLYSSPSSN